MVGSMETMLSACHGEEDARAARQRLCSARANGCKHLCRGRSAARASNPVCSLPGGLWAHACQAGRLNCAPHACREQGREDKPLLESGQGSGGLSASISQCCSVAAEK